MDASLPTLIQGGMGAGVSDWRLAGAVSRLGELGVVSGTGLSTILARRLQDGDPGGHMRRALAQFPNQAAAGRILDRYYLPDARAPGAPYRLAPMYTLRRNPELEALTVAACFVEVFLAKENHDGVVGINLLEKIQLPTLPSLYGAMLAGVDYVLMGAGIPREIPGALDALSVGKPATLRIHVEDAAPDAEYRVEFDPRQSFPGGQVPPLVRPAFLAIVASATLAQALARKSTGRVDGFVVEGPTAGGHNAPPRGTLQVDPSGQPVYGPRDQVDLDRIRELGLPFWLAGGFAERERLHWALAQGAQGIQVGTAFALCEESGLAPTFKHDLRARILGGDTSIFTDPWASPTGYPFKVAQLSGTLSDPTVYDTRSRLCDLGYLRTPFLRSDGKMAFRCPSEPVEAYERKGGRVEDTPGRKCLCNGLIANLGLAQVRPDGSREPPVVTLGDDIASVRRILHECGPGATSYTAYDVVSSLLADEAPRASATPLMLAHSTRWPRAQTPSPTEACGPVVPSLPAGAP